MWKIRKYRTAVVIILMLIMIVSIAGQFESNVFYLYAITALASFGLLILFYGMIQDFEEIKEFNNKH